MDSASKRNKQPSAKAQAFAEAQQEASCDGEEGPFFILPSAFARLFNKP
jgi:hypothetical protein